MNRSSSVRLVWQGIKWRQVPKSILITSMGRLWLVSCMVWLWFFIESQSSPTTYQHLHHQALPAVIDTISSQMSHWLMMLAAMMYPLLIVQINHLVFALPTFRRLRSISLFLLSYSMLWLLFAVSFWTVQAIANSFIIDRQIYSLLGVGCFILASALVWSKSHPILMARCSGTISLNILGWRADIDSILYGAKTAKNCIHNCCLPMLALMLTHHNLSLMLMVTLALWYERFCLSHISKQMSAIWLLLAAITFVTLFA